MTDLAQIPWGPDGPEQSQISSQGERLRQRVWLEARRRPTAVIALLYLVVVVVACIFANVIAPYNPEALNLLEILRGPSWAHPLGTDELGRDVLTRLLYGGRVSLLAAGEAVLTFAVVGLPIGLSAGYFGGTLDRAIMWVTDLVLSLPSIIILLVVAAVIGGNTALMVTFGAITSPVLIRTTRAATLAVRQELYVRAAEVIGLPSWRVLKNHVVPRVLPTVLIQLTVFASAAIVIETALGFLGFDATPPAPSWGSMVAEAASAISQSQWMMVTTGLTIALTALALGVVGDAIRDISTGELHGGLITTSRRRRATQTQARLANSVTVGNRRAQAALGPPDEDAFANAPQDALLSVRDLSVAASTASGELQLVDRVTFDLRRGECLGIVGESGCGKSITALAVLGLLPQGCKITGGTIHFDGKDVTMLAKGTTKHLRRGIGYVSQEPMQALDPGMTVGRVLREVLRRNQDLTRTVAREEAINLLAQVRIPNPKTAASRYPHELSGGMAQRVCIALALAGKPQLIIADEPTTALDVTVQAEILDLLHALRAEQGVAVLLITHDWGVVADSSDHAAVMYAGELVERGRVTDIFSRPLHPYTEALLLANPHRVSSGPLTTLPGSVLPPGKWPEGCRFAVRCGYATEECRTAPVTARDAGGRRVVRCLYPERVGATRQAIDV